MVRKKLFYLYVDELPESNLSYITFLVISFRCAKFH